MRIRFIAPKWLVRKRKKKEEDALPKEHKRNVFDIIGDTIFNLSRHRSFSIGNLISGFLVLAIGFSLLGKFFLFLALIIAPFLIWKSISRLGDTF